MTTPNPGSQEAQKGGCTCAVMGNHYRQGIPMPDGVQFWINDDCPLHGKKARELREKAGGIFNSINDAKQYMTNISTSGGNNG